MRLLALAALTLGLSFNAQAADSLRLGYLPSTGHAKFFIAKEQNFFAQEGLEVQMLEFVNSADGLNAIIADKIDIGAFGTTGPLSLIHI